MTPFTDVMGTTEPLPGWWQFVAWPVLVLMFLLARPRGR